MVRAETATDWVARNQDRLASHAGKYIAVSSTGLIGVSDDFDEVFRKARAKGVMNPLVFKMPKPHGSPKVVSGWKR